MRERIHSRAAMVFRGLFMLVTFAVGLSAAEPTPYRHFQLQAKRVLEPLAALMESGKSDLPINGPRSTFVSDVNRLERVARTMLAAAYFLQSKPEAEDAALRARLAAWYRDALVIGSDPASPQYWGHDSGYDQRHVEMGLIAIGLQIARHELWDPLSADQKRRVARWLGTVRGDAIIHNNHYFMSVHVLEFLDAMGFEEASDRAVIRAQLDELEAMYRGGGWFIDGVNQTFDYYNAYAFHFYGLWWARLYGARDPQRAARWRKWGDTFTTDLRYFFAASGENPPFGRSLSYRFNIVAPFALVAAEECTTLPLGELRRITLRNVDFFLDRPIYNEQGAIALGWSDRFDAAAEGYSGSGSPYWCAKGFTALILPPDHPFWTSPEQPLASERGNFVHPIPTAGLVVRGINGEVELINAGTAPSYGLRGFGLWKWTKFAYRTGTGFTLAPEAWGAGTAGTTWSPDNALVLQLPDGRRFGRYTTTLTEMDDRHVACVYNFGVPGGDVNTSVTTQLWWRGDWLLQIHHVRSYQPAKLQLGGYALGSAEPNFERSSPLSVAGRASAADGRATALQTLLGFRRADWDQRLDDKLPRAHLLAPYHVTPVASTDEFVGERWLVALVGTGRGINAGPSWTVRRGEAGHWELEHPQLGRWTIDHPDLPALPH